MNKYIVQAKAMDGRYDQPISPLYNEGEFAPIYAQDDFKRFPKGKFLKNPQGDPIVQWPGGRYPSGHIEVYQPQHPDAWRNQTLPMSLEDADKVARERSERVSTTNGKPNFIYRVKETSS